MHLKDDQWYQLPSGQWVKAILVDDPIGPILQAYGADLASSTGYTNTFDIYVEGDGQTLGVTGLCTWDTWTLADLREATPDEAEAQTYRALHLSLPTDEEPMSTPASDTAIRPSLTVRVMPCLDCYPTVTYDVFVVDHPEFAAGGDDATTSVLDAVQRILAQHPRCTLRIETVEDFALAVPALQAYAREHLETDSPAAVLEHVLAELRAAHADHLARYLEERRDLSQLTEAWQVRMAINKLAHIAALSYETQG
jgi:hypothetical protein